jgi:hypothetical protein
MMGSVTVQNVGRQIAGDVRIFVQMAVSNDRNLASFPLPEREEAEGVGVLSPSAVLRRGAERSVPYGDVETAKASGARYTFLFVWGACWYQDGFGEDRTSCFCHRYNVASGSGDEMTFSISEEKARYQETGNVAD